MKFSWKRSQVLVPAKMQAGILEALDRKTNKIINQIFDQHVDAMRILRSEGLTDNQIKKRIEGRIGACKKGEAVNLISHRYLASLELVCNAIKNDGKVISLYDIGAAQDRIILAPFKLYKNTQFAGA